MKKILSALLLCFSVSAFACGGDSTVYPKWSIGVIGIADLEMPLHSGHTYYLPGIQFTYSRSGVWALRAAIEHTRYSSVSPDYPSGGADLMYVEGSERRTVLRVGVERGWSLHRLFRPYAALDLAGHLARSDMWYNGGIAGIYQNKLVSTKGIGLMPAVGFKTAITKKISFYLEYRAEAFLNDVDTRITDYMSTVDPPPTSETQFDFKGGDIYLAGIQVMF